MVAVAVEVAIGLGLTISRHAHCQVILGFSLTPGPRPGYAFAARHLGFESFFPAAQFQFPSVKKRFLEQARSFRGEMPVEARAVLATGQALESLDH
jgi:hypothetical protein